MVQVEKLRSVGQPSHLEEAKRGGHILSPRRPAPHPQGSFGQWHLQAPGCGPGLAPPPQAPPTHLPFLLNLLPALGFALQIAASPTPACTNHRVERCMGICLHFEERPLQEKSPFLLPGFVRVWSWQLCNQPPAISGRPLISAPSLAPARQRRTSARHQLPPLSTGQYCC